MFFRLRKSNLSLERAVYKPAEKDAQGNILVHAVRTTEYVGSISAYTVFSNISRDLLAKLDADEQAELKENLQKNEIPPDYWLSSLPRQLQRCCQELKDCAGLSKGLESRKKLELNVKEAEKEWAAFYKTAQEIGLKRKLNRAKKQLVETGQKAAPPPTDSPQ